MRRIKPLIRELLLCVGTVGLVMSLLWCSIKVTSPTAGPLASQLGTGDEVFTFGPVSATVLDEANFGKKLDLNSATCCIVVSDPTGDEDDCSGNFDRIITVKVDAGEHQGKVVTIPRRDLRVRMKWYDLRQGR